MFVLGLNAYHGDAAACLLRDGKIIAAAEEERFRRIKHWAGFPSEAIRYCLAEAGVKLADVDHIAINSDPKANILRRLRYAFTQRPDLQLVLDRVRNQSKRLSIERELEMAFPGDAFRGKIYRVEHHLAHLASCFLVSPFEEAVTVSVDGFGDFASAAWGRGRGTSITMDGRVWFPHSLGVFYQALTQYLGFPHYGDEYKVMGLAPYGEPRFVPEMRRIVLLQNDGTYRLDTTYFRHHKEKISYEWSGGSPHVGTLFSPALEDLLGPARGKDEPLEQRHKDIARSVQAMYEEAFFHLLNSAARALSTGQPYTGRRLRDEFSSQRQGQAEHTLQAGLCPIGSRRRRGRDRRCDACVARTWRRASTTDCGSASALAGDVVAGRTVMDHAYLGPRAEDGEIEDLIAARAAELATQGCRIERLADEAELCRRTAAGNRRWHGRRLVPGPHGVGPARARQPLHRLRSASRRHERHPESQDQAAGKLPPLRTFDLAGACWRMVRGRG